VAQATVVLNRVSLLLIVMVAALTLAVAYLGFWPVTVLTVQDQNNLVVVTPFVRAGERLQYILPYCKFRTIPATNAYQLVNTEHIFIPGDTTNGPTGCGSPKVSFIVPPDTPAGQYRLIIIVSYQINFLHHETSTLRTDSFAVA
jgi:hypothetical protein